MQTFLPSDNFFVSARMLDRQRLGKQRVETLQILQALSGQSKGWKNHPATKMWQGYEYLLGQYGIIMCREWKDRGYVDNTAPRIQELARQYEETDTVPFWLGVERFHQAHRNALLFKKPDHYQSVFAAYGYQAEPILDYWWPI